MVKALCESVRQAWYSLLKYEQKSIDEAIKNIARILVEEMDYILKANQMDMENAKAAGMDPVMQDRLLLTEERLLALSSSVDQIAKLEDPYKKIQETWTLENGLVVEKRKVPFGVVGMIYESRPNVTVDAAVIALKTGNAIVLKGGKEAFETNLALIRVMRNGLNRAGLPEDAIGFVATTERSAALELLSMKGLVDVLIPRGSAGLIEWVSANAKIPVIETGAGNCHIYVDQEANVAMALDIIENAKVQRPSVCNAVEKVLIHQSIAPFFLHALEARLGNRVTFRVDDRAKPYIKNATPMQAEEYHAEYLDYILGVRVVSDVDEAIRWINTYGTHHSDCIITENDQVAQYFQKLVDSAAVYHNASTRFTDGGEFGFGAEIGIATSKLHARGPMGIEAMTTYKYCIHGNGQVRR